MLSVKGKIGAGLGISGLGGLTAGILTVGIATSQPQSSSPSVSGTDPGHARYSPLTEINAKNVNSLKPVWVYDTGAKGRGWQEHAIVVDGVMYLSIPGGAAALDPETGKEIWKFSPTDLTRPGRDRGVAYWPGDGTLGP